MDIEIEYWQGLVDHYKELRNIANYGERYSQAQEQRDLAITKRKQLTEYNKEYVRNMIDNMNEVYSDIQKSRRF